MSDAEGEDPELQKDDRTGWIYSLNRDELVQEMHKFGLPTEGTVPELTTTLSTFLKEGIRPNPPTLRTEPGGSQESEPHERTVIVHHQPSPWHVCDTVRRWNVKYNGETDAIAFLERLEELIEAYKFTHEDLLTALPQLLSDKALLWYRNNKLLWNEWKDFMISFQNWFLPSRYRQNLQREIINRTQAAKETARSYSVAINTLLRRLGTGTTEEKLQRVYENLQPKYKLYIKRRDFATLDELLELATEYEELEEAAVEFCPPPPPSKVYFPETAYSPQSKKVRYQIPLDSMMLAEEAHQEAHPGSSRASSRSNSPGRVACSYGDENRRNFKGKETGTSGHTEERKDNRSARGSRSTPSENYLANRNIQGRSGRPYPRPSLPAETGINGCLK
jgi:hypothetical protein